MARRRESTPPLTKYVPFRCTAAEHEKLSQLARVAGHSRADILRSFIHQQRALTPAPAPMPIFDEKALRALARIGNNLNQIARELHRRDRQGVSPEDFAALNRAILQVITVTLSGKAAAEILFNDGLVAFMAQLPIARQRGPSEPSPESPVGKA